MSVSFFLLRTRQQSQDAIVSFSGKLLLVEGEILRLTLRLDLALTSWRAADRNGSQDSRDSGAVKIGEGEDKNRRWARKKWDKEASLNCLLPLLLRNIESTVHFFMFPFITRKGTCLRKYFGGFALIFWLMWGRRLNRVTSSKFEKFDFTPQNHFLFRIKNMHVLFLYMLLKETSHLFSSITLSEKFHSWGIARTRIISPTNMHDCSRPSRQGV